MDLSTLSDQDLQALSRGDLKAMSDAGFAALVKAQEAATPLPAKMARTRAQMAEQADPTKGMSTGGLALAGIGKGMAAPIQAVGQALGMMNRSDVDEMQRRDAPLMSTTAGKLGYMGGAGAVGAPLALAPGANTMLGAAMYGGLAGAAQPVGTEESVAGNMARGATAAGLLTGGANAASRVLSPRVDPAARSLMNEGVPLTPGQQAGGWLKRAEEGATSLPVTGDAIRNAQLRSVQGFNAAVANRALQPIGGKLPANVAGRDAVQYVETAIGRVYDSALGRLKNIKADQTLTGELSSLQAMVKGSPMPKDVQRQFDSVLTSQVKGKLQGQKAMTAETFKQADSEIGRLAAKYAGDASVDKQLLGDALSETQAILRRWLERSAPKDVSDDIAAANRGWAEFKRMQRAASMTGSRDGVFSPEAYMSAVRALDQSKDKGAYARGSAMGQDIGQAGLDVIGRTVPDSGTPFRTLVANPLQGLLSVGLTAPATAAYSSPRTLSVLQTLMSGKRPALATKAAAELEMIAPALGAMGGIGAVASERVR